MTTTAQDFSGDQLIDQFNFLFAFSTDGAEAYRDPDDDGKIVVLCAISTVLAEQVITWMDRHNYHHKTTTNHSTALRMVFDGNYASSRQEISETVYTWELVFRYPRDNGQLSQKTIRFNGVSDDIMFKTKELLSSPEFSEFKCDIVWVRVNHVQVDSFRNPDPVEYLTPNECRNFIANSIENFVSNFKKGSYPNVE